MFADVVRFVRPSQPWSLRLTGMSMLPRMLEGDELLVDPARYPGLGDVIVFPHQDKLVAHRVVGTGAVFLTAGDASRGALEHVERADVLGTVVEIRRSDRVVQSHVRSRIVALLLRARLALKYHFRLVR
jgi:hypothetical protein